MNDHFLRKLLFITVKRKEQTMTTEERPEKELMRGRRFSGLSILTAIWIFAFTFSAQAADGQTVRISNVKVGIGKHCYVEFSYIYSIVPGKRFDKRIKKPFVGIYILRQTREGVRECYLVKSGFAHESRVIENKTKHRWMRSLSSRNSLKNTSKLMPEIAMTTESQRVAGYVFPYHGSNKEKGKILVWRCEIWQNGKLMAAKNSYQSIQLDQLSLPPDWYEWKKYPDKFQYQ